MDASLNAALATTGFSVPVFDSQHAFRSIMNAMSRPGSIHKIALDFTPPAELPLAAAAALLALCDFETSLWVAAGWDDNKTVSEYCLFHSGAMRAASPAAAQFALVDLHRQKLRLADFSQGTAEYPDRSTMIIALVSSLRDGPVSRLTGPGIQDQTEIALEGLPADFAAQWANNYSGFPLGVDIIFCAGAEVLALPRSTRIIEKS